MSKGHAVIDGSNLATEGRSEPSLAQLDEAVDAIAAEYDFAQITVIVDATFEHRVAKSETKAARKAIDDNKIITPPAGVIGRGDAFILQVADRANAVVFSNDSFQEFHAIYDWLFDEGRLIGGKPIPGVGWIYVPRSPVRGPVSRRVTADKRRSSKSEKASTKAATPSSVEAKATEEKPPSRRRGAKKSAPPKPSAAPRGDGSNDAAVWKAFKSDYPVGSTIAATVDRFSSHGAYGSVDNVEIYLPNRLLGNPAPTKARDIVDLGATMDFVIHRYDSDRYGIDAGLIPAPGAPRKPKAAKKTTAKRAPATKKAAKKAVAKPAAKKAPAAKPAVKKSAAKKTAKKTANKTAAKKTTKTTTAKKTAKNAPARKAGATRSVKKTTAKKSAARATAKKRS